MTGAKGRKLAATAVITVNVFLRGAIVVRSHNEPNTKYIPVCFHSTLGYVYCNMLPGNSHSVRGAAVLVVIGVLWVPRTVSGVPRGGNGGGGEGGGSACYCWYLFVLWSLSGRALGGGGGLSCYRRACFVLKFLGKAAVGGGGGGVGGGVLVCYVSLLPLFVGVVREVRAGL